MKRIFLLLTVAVLMAASALPAFAQEGDKCTGIENRAEGNVQALEGAIKAFYESDGANLEPLGQIIGASEDTLTAANEAGCTGGAITELFTMTAFAESIWNPPPPEYM